MSISPASSQHRDIFDVIVVGAGLSGLHAAYLLQEIGLSTLILEARDRVGGKTLSTDRVDGITVKQEYGAAWINNSTQSQIWKLACELGLAGMVQLSEGKVVAQDIDGNCIEAIKQCLTLRDMVEDITTCTDGPLQSHVERESLDSISFGTYLHRNTKGSKRAQASAKTTSELEEGYCRCEAIKKHGGQYIRVKEGVSSFGERMLQRLVPGTLKLESPVKTIKEISELGLTQVTITAAGGAQSFLAKRVIISIPSPVYRTITFSPPLSPKKRAYVNATRYSSYTKYLIMFKTPFWREKGYCGLAQSFVGPVSVFRDTSADDAEDQQYCLTCFICGSFARSWSALSSSEKRSAVLKQVSVIFAGGRDITVWFEEALESPWMDEEYSGWGCPMPILPPGVLSRCWDAFTATEGALHFIGNETATIWRGYMDGAIRTAERGSAEVIAALKAQKASP
ncbi:hypothetical protein OIDMADRAFT_61307 [Oidiodendron maius Zn]|uniref:Amine oxidase n=1 Tax=Oidiodendron maius (strain Zn) TaxID=913774 RepID=A0A0C3GBY2_OIDMZ|nr:hypothetical protein OIDMADRAFT_61307 [Oidiodendron maius Zn]